VSSNHAYVRVHELGLIVYDVSNPAQPLQVGHYPHCGLGDTVAISGQYAYVGKGLNQDILQIVDIHRPAEPRLFSEVRLQAGLISMDVVDGIVFTAGGSLVAVDVRDPSQPRPGASVRMPDRAKEVKVVGRFAYVADESWGLVIVDVSDPIHPRLLSTFEGGFARQFSVSVDVEGTTAYVLATDNGIFAVDAHDPMKQAFVGGITFPGGPQFGEVRVKNGYVYAATEFLGFTILEPVEHPELKIAQSGEEATISWESYFGGFDLEVSDDMRNWVRAPTGSQNPVTVPTSHRSSLFYRLSKP
jgi:hypothetical protein